MFSKLISPERAFLEYLFSLLNAREIRYAVLRNYETLPQSTGGSDLDILVYPEDEEKARAAIAEAIRQADGVVIGYADLVSFTKISVFGRGDIREDFWWGVEIDLFWGVYFGGVAQLINNDILIRGFRLHNGIRVLPYDLVAVLGVVKELLHNNILLPRYLTVALEIVKIKWNELRVDLAPMGEPALALLQDLFLSAPGSPHVAAKSRAFRRALMRTAFLRSPLTYLWFRFLHEWSKVNRYLNPPGIVVTVLGTDGVGKTTVISAIEPTLSAATHGAFIIKHLRPGLLPPLARLKGKKAQQDAPVTAPHGSESSNGFSSLLRVLYLLADYVLGYWLVVRPIISKRPTIVLFDRYAYDMALDPRRFRIGLPSRLVRLFTRFAPKPDLIICLHGDPYVIATRKQEIPVEEIARQLEALREFFKKEPRAIFVSTDGCIEEVRDHALAGLRKHCSVSNDKRSEQLSQFSGNSHAKK